MPVDQNVTNLIKLFNDRFKHTENTILVKGEDEPIYLPAGKKQTYNQIVFAHGYFSSALHEISHWCIAGEARRKLVDFGYWYEPDGRSVEQQQAFEQVEIKPQALEWIFSIAAGVKFNISADNLGGDVSPTADIFKQNVRNQAECYLKQGLPKNAQQFTDTLVSHYCTKDKLTLSALQTDKL